MLEADVKPFGFVCLAANFALVSRPPKPYCSICLQLLSLTEEQLTPFPRTSYCLYIITESKTERSVLPQEFIYVNLPNTCRHLLAPGQVSLAREPR